jgi:ATP-dependent helicase/nuclease subunit B
VNPFARESPRWFNIPAHRSFVDDLARGLLEAIEGGPEALSEVTVLLPSRRGARALAEAFVRAAGGQAVLLPQIRALGDLDEGEPPFEPGDLALDLPPAISLWRRRFELAGLVAQHQDELGRSLDATAALELADALGTFFDSLQIEEARDLARIDELAPESLAKHWQISSNFLRIATEAWPARLSELGLIDVTERRVALLDRLAEGWTVQPPTGVMVAAGSTGSAPATARLLSVIAGLPQGCVVLPGLDDALSEKAWAQVGEQHPQSAMKRLLETAGVTRGEVMPWRGADTDARGRWRRRVINEALRPAEATADWRAQIAQLRKEALGEEADPIAQGLEGLSLVSARTENEAADAIALLLREVLETPGKTAALVTPDLALARRVSARLARWAVSVDSSAGFALASTPAAVLANLVAATAPKGCDPVGLLAILKHPFVRLSLSPEMRERGAVALERYGLRGPRPRTWDDLLERLATAESEVADAIEIAGLLRGALNTALEPYTGGLAAPSEAARALTSAMEGLAADAAGEFGGLWAGVRGECLGGLLSALMHESEGLPEVTPAQFAELLQRLVEGETVRAGAGTHARLHILGALEGRLVRADRLILAGLEEGVWPRVPPIDPFLSRPMRKVLGLPPPERRLGLSAHDFAQAACAPEVVLVHSERRDEAPAVKSRWLWRLETLAAGAEVALPGHPSAVAWARALDAPLGPARGATRPKPTPPLEVRPRLLPVTGVEQWIRDPYGAYARRILHLRPLDPPDAPIEARARGTAVHAAFEAFALQHTEVGEASAEVFRDLLVKALEEAGTPEARMTRELALAENVSRWVVAFERRRRPGARLLIEQEGRLTFAAGMGLFTVTAKADRIELRTDRADIIDFKTGTPPSIKQVEEGLAPQLTLTAAILAAGGFAEAGPMRPGELLYVRVSGTRKPAEELVRAGEAESARMAEEALDGLKRRVERFDDLRTPYVSWAMPQFIGRHGGDYDHLARVWEWRAIAEDEDY